MVFVAAMIGGGILLLSATFVWLLAGGITVPVIALAIASMASRPSRKESL